MAEEPPSNATWPSIHGRIAIRGDGDRHPMKMNPRAPASSPIDYSPIFLL
ncbi:hypothetical protein P3T23_009104, partial [Paraburkholderia sp. GAS448]